MNKNGINDEHSQVTERPLPPPASNPVQKGALTDAAIANDLKRRAIEAYQPVLALCDEARALGLSLRIGSNLGPMGKEQVALVEIVKVY